MKFTCKVFIDRPLPEVIDLWKNPENLVYWQEGFVSTQPVKGEMGQKGSQTLFYYKHGKKDMELLETIEKNDLPGEFTATYEHKHMTNRMRNTFSEAEGRYTIWNAEVEYLEFNGLMPKMMAFLFPKMFEKQTQKWLDRFKDFAESPHETKEE